MRAQHLSSRLVFLRALPSPTPRLWLVIVPLLAITSSPCVAQYYYASLTKNRLWLGGHAYVI